MPVTGYAINNRLFDPYLEIMNFLNEISILNPGAISFASGRPDRQFFNVREIVSGFHSFIDVGIGTGEPVDTEDLYNALGQYNKTKGIINERVARLLKNDENIEADPEDIILTDGAQEGMVIVINTLFDPGSGKDVLLVSDPSYIGFVGYAKIWGVPIRGIRRADSGIDADHLEQTILDLKKEGKHAKVLYDVPDFHNPTGDYMSLEKRKELLTLAEKYNFFVVEDNPYGYFRFDTEKIPTLKALDRNQRVIHLGSFSKTIFPSIRMGYLVADQEIVCPDRSEPLKLVEELKKTKSYTTVNTSTLLQGIAGSFLQKLNYSMLEYCRPKAEACRKNRDTLLEALAAHFPGDSSRTNNGGIRWSKPSGGFFLVMDLPFKVTRDLVKECVEQYNVIFCPMFFFCLEGERAANAHQIRLAYSTLPPEKIREGAARLAGFIKTKTS
jgi:(S)-3,5-dihydroxyphenylglycine transaminase